MRALSLLLALVVAAPSQAQDFVVTVTEDVDDGACDAHCTLREAIAAANASSDMNTITFAPELREQTIQLTQGALLITKSMRIDADDLDITVSGDGSDSVFHTQVYSIATSTPSQSV